MPIIELGIAIAALLGGSGGLIASSRKMERDGSSAGRSSEPVWTPPVQPQSYAPQPYGGDVWPDAPPPSHYAEDFGQGFQGFPAQNEVTLIKTGRHWHANVGYGDNVMNLMVDTGASTCIVGDEVWRWLKSQGIRSSGKGQASIAGGRIVSTERFTFPYLTVVGSDNQSFVTVTDVEAQYLPGESGLLGMSFLGRCHVEFRGDQMIIRG